MPPLAENRDKLFTKTRRHRYSRGQTFYFRQKDFPRQVKRSYWLTPLAQRKVSRIYLWNYKLNLIRYFPALFTAKVKLSRIIRHSIITFLMVSLSQIWCKKTRGSGSGFMSEAGSIEQFSIVERLHDWNSACSNQFECKRWSSVSELCLIELQIC